MAWRVQWYDGNERRSRTFERKQDAVAFEARVRLAKRRGDLEDLDAGRQTLSDFAAEWESRYAKPNLERNTLLSYEILWSCHVAPRLGSFQLRQLKPALIESFAGDLHAAGVGEETIRKSLALLQGMLKRAVLWGRIETNPVSAVRKPSRRRKRTVQPLAPATVEQIRAHLLRQRRHLDATLVSALAYAGLRPGEALALTWADVRENTLLVDKALALGEVHATKTGRTRTVRLLKPLAADLAEWRIGSGRPERHEPVFPMRNGSFWTHTAYRNWRARIYTPAASAVGIEDPRPYDLRHSLASLLFLEGVNPAEIAETMGHSVQTLLDVYTHVLNELRGEKPQSAEKLIRAAREPHRKPHRTEIAPT